MRRCPAIDKKELKAAKHACLDRINYLESQTHFHMHGGYRKRAIELEKVKLWCVERMLTKEV